jgi:membrane protein YdbS with pleckstrin-like domain
MSVFETDSRLPFTAGIIAVLLALGGAAAAIIGAVFTPVSVITFLYIAAALVLCVAAGIVAWHIYGYVRSSYALDRNAFVIRWGNLREVIPMADIQRVIAATDIADGLVFRRFPLPGWWRGAGRHPALGRITFYATENLQNQIVIITPERSYAISPYDAEAFLDAFNARYDMRPTQLVAYNIVEPAYHKWAFWRDRAAHALLLAMLAAHLGLIALATARYPSVPVQIPLHFDAAGVVDRVGARAQMFTPVFAASILLLLGIGAGLFVYARSERGLSYLLWGGGAAVQAMFVIAVLTISFS